jgi:3'(2'),5'-bisphosphate nucleotidase
VSDHALPYAVELDAAVAAARAAGAIIKAFYDGAAAATYAKTDGSPVTDADLAADRAIRTTLQERFPDSPMLSEEGEDDRSRLGRERCWIVDPLDGTEQFIQRTGEFDVLIALVERGRPVVGVGYQPATGLLVTATAGGGAWTQRDGEAPRRVTLEPASDPPRVATSKWFGAPENGELIAATAARLGRNAEAPTVTGFSPRIFLSPRRFDAMLGIRPGEDQTMAFEWDFAVPDLVIHEAGGRVTNLAGEPFRYNKRVPHNVGGLVATVDPATHDRLLEAIAAVRSAMVAR